MLSQGLRTLALALAATLAVPGIAAATPAASAAARGRTAEPAARPLDINSASARQLQTLPGIGAEEARRIVAKRPYRSKADLVTLGVIPEGTYVSIKNRIAAVPKAGGAGSGVAARKPAAP